MLPSRSRSTAIDLLRTVYVGLFYRQPCSSILTCVCNRQSNVDLLALAERPDSGEQALQRLTSGAIPQEELILSIEAVFSSEKVIEMVRHLQTSEAQAFVEAVYEVWLRLPVFLETVFDLTHLIGVGETRLSSTYSKRLLEVVVWAVRWPQSASKVSTDRAKGRSYGTSAVLRWVRGCVEMRTPGATGCCKGIEDVRKQGLAKGHSCEPLVAFR
jgi:hypothetical protein